jgi:hypothetical protein
MIQTIWILTTSITNSGTHHVHSMHLESLLQSRFFSFSNIDPPSLLIGMVPSNHASRTVKTSSGSLLPQFVKSSTPHKSLGDHTLYGRVLKKRNWQDATYKFTAALSNGLLLTQVVLGAALTALGASESSHILITVFGAMNTVIAGMIA